MPDETDAVIRVLLLASRPDEALLLNESLQQDRLNSFHLVHAGTLEAGLAHIDQADFDAILLDLHLPDSQGLATLKRVHHRAPGLPLVLFSARLEEQTALEAIRLGAQDFLAKGPGGFETAARVLRCAIQRQKLNRSLLQSEQSFFTAFHTSPAAQIIHMAESGLILYANEAYSRMVGYSRAELVGHTTLELGLWADPQDHQEMLRQLQQNGRVRDLETRFRTRSGQVRTLLYSMEPIDLMGERCIISSALDITERKHAEIALQESEALYRLLAENMSDTIWLMDASLRTVYASPSVYRLRGYTLEEINSLPLEQQMTPDSLQRAMATLAEALSPHNLGQPSPRLSHTIELEFYCKDGRLFWSENSFTLILDQNGALKNILGVGRDITDRKRAEAELRQEQEKLVKIAATVPGLICSFRQDPQGNYSMPYASPMIGEVYGLEPRAIAADITPLFARFHPDDIGRVVETIAQSARQMSPWRDEYRYLHPTKGEIWLEGASMPVPEPDGGILWHGFIYDVTGRKLAQMQARQRTEDLELVNTINLAVNRGDDLPAIIRLMSAGVRRIFDCSAVLTFLPDAQQQYLLLNNLDFPASISKKIEKLVGSRLADLPLSVPLAGDGYYAQAARARQPVLIQDRAGIQAMIADFTHDHPGLRAVIPAIYRLLDIHAVVLVPMMADSRLVGLLALDRRQPFTESDLERVQVLARQATTAIGRVQAEQDLRLSEEKYRSLVESSDALIAMVDAAGRIHFVNQTGRQFLGLQPGAVVGKTLHDLLPAEMADMYLQDIRQVLQHNAGKVYDMEIDSRWYRLSVQPIHDAQGRALVAHFSAADVTELRRAQQELLELTHSLEQRVAQRTAEVQDLYENAPCGYHSLDAQGRFLRINQTELDWFGYSREEIIGRPFTDFVTPQSQKVFQENFPIFLRTGRIKDLEFELLRKDGALMPVLVNATAIYDSQGQFLMSRSIVFDNTERKQAEDALRQSEETYRALFEAANDAIFLIDLEHKLVRANPRCSQLLGLDSGDNLLGRGATDFVAPRELADARRRLQEVLSAGIIPPYERTMLRKDGSKIFTEITLSLLRDADGAPRLIQSVVRDITQRKQAEDALRQSEEHNRLLFDASPDAITLLDPHGRILRANRAYAHLAGLEIEQILGKTAEELGLVSQETRRQLLETVQDSLAREEDFAAVEYVLFGADGSAHNLESRIFLLDIGGFYHILVSSRDISLHKRAEEALRVANLELEAALRLKDEFLANMSHELRTPLNAVLSISESLAEEVAGPLNEKQRHYVTTVYESGRHLLALINDILDLAKIDAGKITLEIDRLPLKEVAESSLRMVRELAHKKRLELSYAQDLDIHTIQADERRLKQMIVNLLSNAVKFTPEGGKVGLEIHGDASKGQALITVWDTGIGIPASDQERLFRPFTQLDTGLARQYSGAGLGLALVFQMARLHGGSVSVQSSPGEGSRFTLVLPWSGEQPAGRAVAPQVIQDSAALLVGLPRQHRHSILLVEDTPEVVVVLQDYLEKMGFQVAVAGDGLEGIAQARLLQPDVILMDVQMPLVDGLEATRQIRAVPALQHTPIIALTALAMPGDRQRCLEAGMNAYLSKPVDLKGMLRSIQKLLHPDLFQDAQGKENGDARDQHTAG